MIEYQGRCDENDNALGHAPKVLKEYYDFIKDYCDVTVLAPELVINASGDNDFTQMSNLPCKIVMKGHTPFVEKISNKFHMFKNIDAAIKYANTNGEGTLWFFNIEYYILLYLLFHRKPAHKIYFTMFTDGYFSDTNSGIKEKITTNIKQWVFEKVQKKIDLIISSGPSFNYKNCSNVFIPDYSYDSAQLSNFVQKTDSAVCLGTMGQGKQLKEMIQTFNKIRYPLIIAGRFYDKDLFEELTQLANDNITLSDMYLTYDQYQELLTSAKYTILPYPKEKYSHQTSGVLQEALFADTIPVTYDAILKANGIPGIGFFSWDSLNEPMLYADPSKIYAKYYELKTTVYSKEHLADKYKEIFGDFES